MKNQIKKEEIIPVDLLKNIKRATYLFEQLHKLEKLIGVKFPIILKKTKEECENEAHKKCGEAIRPITYREAFLQGALWATNQEKESNE